MKTIRALLLVIVLLLVVDSALAYYIWTTQWEAILNFIEVRNSGEAFLSDLNQKYPEFEQINNNQPAVENNENLNVNQDIKQGSTKCSTMDCLIALAENCQIGEFDYAQTIPFPFEPLMTYNAVTYFKIKGLDANGDCTFDQQTKTVLLSVTHENKQKIIADGNTEAEIDAQLQMINDSYKAVVDQVNQCQGTNENVATYLKNLEIGKNVSVSCSLGVGSSICTYEPNINCVSARVQNHSNPNCTLSTLTSELGLYPGVSVSIPATGYNDGSQLSWQISDPSIASVSATNGESVMIGGIKAGSTELKITDNAVGADCFVTIPVTVETINI